MAWSHAPSDPSRPPRSGGAGPWAAFVLAMVVVMTAGLTAVLVSLPQGNDQTNARLHTSLPFPPNFKMPAPPAMPRG
jgi:hypothetical protein